MNLDQAQQRELLELARASIESALERGEPVPYTAHPLHPELTRPGASFITLRIGEDLRGCCGSVEATRPLAEDVWHNACASAFGDPRFPALTADEWRDTDLQISVLSEPELMQVANEAELLETLRPGIDGLILQHGARRSTFLPAVWDQLPDAPSFVRHLKLKAGWPLHFWPPDMRAWRYTTESF
jgi:AmmeMemoRadiSam system protein A